MREEDPALLEILEDVFSCYTVLCPHPSAIQMPGYVLGKNSCYLCIKQDLLYIHVHVCGCLEVGRMLFNV